MKRRRCGLGYGVAGGLRGEEGMCSFEEGGFWVGSLSLLLPWLVLMMLSLIRAVCSQCSVSLPLRLSSFITFPSRFWPSTRLLFVFDLSVSPKRASYSASSSESTSASDSPLSCSESSITSLAAGRTRSRFARGVFCGESSPMDSARGRDAKDEGGARCERTNRGVDANWGVRGIVVDLN